MLAPSACGDDDAASSRDGSTVEMDAQQDDGASGDAATGADAGADRDAACTASDAGTFPAVDAEAPSPLCEGARCGGDLTGTWEILAVCAGGMGDGSFLRCAEGTLTVHGVAVSGRWTFGPDGSVTLVGTEHATADAHLPLSCYGLRDCDALAGLAAAGGLAAECLGSGPLDSTCRYDACDCRIVLDEPELMASATVTNDPLEGTFSLVFGMETIEGEYCVESDGELWLHATRFGGVEYRYRMRRVAE